MNKNENRIVRKRAVKIDSVLGDFLTDRQNSKLIIGLNHHLIESAWDSVSGAKSYTLRCYFTSGKLYITLSSSLVRSQLNFQKEDIRKGINNMLYEDTLCISYHKNKETVKELIIR